MAAVGAISSSEQAGPEPVHIKNVREALHDYLGRETDLYYELYLHIGGYLGFRLKDPLDLRHFVLAIGALAEGIALRLNFFPEYNRSFEGPVDDLTGESPTWSIAALGVEAIADAMLELDPDWSVDRGDPLPDFQTVASSPSVPAVST